MLIYDYRPRPLLEENLTRTLILHSKYYNTIIIYSKIYFKIRYKEFNS